MVDYLPDPVEIMEQRIERECDKIDADGLYPCAGCKKPTELDELFSVSPNPDAPAVCGECFEDVFPQLKGDGNAE